MNENDISNILNQFNKMLENNEIPEDFKNIINNFKNSSNNPNNSTSTGNSQNFSNNSHFDNANSSSSTNFNNANSNNSSSNNPNNADNFVNEFPDIDINTILKIKQVMSSINSNKHDPRANLLISLKPYLKESRKKKVDEYVKLFSISKAFEAFGSLGGENKNDK